MLARSAARDKKCQPRRRMLARSAGLIKLTLNRLFLKYSGKLLLGVNTVKAPF